MAVLASLWQSACDEEHELPPAASSEPSPNARILPAPLVSARQLLPPSEGEAAAGARGLTSGGGREVPLPPVNFDPLAGIEEKTPPPPDSLYFSAQGSFSWPWLAPRAGHGIRLTELKKLAEGVTFDVGVELRPSGRLRWEFQGNGFPLDKGSALLARRDYLGQVLVWPSGKRYRLLSPGALRSVLLEGRADVVPLVHATESDRQHGAQFGYDTVRERLTTPSGALELEQAELPACGAAGELLCRLLLELMAVDPSSKVCAPGLLPVVAHYRESGQDVIFRMTQLQRRSDPTPRALLVPPPRARLETRELPRSKALLAVDRGARQALRSRADLAELVIVNGGERLRYAALQGVPIAYLPPKSQLKVRLPRGHYNFAWTDFFGVRDVQPPAPEAIDVPSRVHLGAPLPLDAGVP